MDLANLKDRIGKELGVSEWLVVSQTMIEDFARTTLDDQWIHTDVERARLESPYRTTVAHGFLTLSLLSHLHRSSVNLADRGFSRAINYGLNRVRFPTPVRAGARIRSRSVLKEVEEMEGGIQVTWSVTVEVEGEPKPALVAEWIGRAYR
jgi:acyl dehydratase